jgi:hypothetical protein
MLHCSSHLISVFFRENHSSDLSLVSYKTIRKILEDYIYNFINDSRINFSDELEKRFIVNVIRVFNKETKTYTNIFAYIWCSKEVFDILMNRVYIKVCDIPKKISEEQEKICRENICWSDVKDEDDSNYDEFLKSSDNVKKKIFFTDEEILKKTKEYLEEAKRNEIKLEERVVNEYFDFTPAKCWCSMNRGNIIKMINYLEKGQNMVRIKKNLIDEVEKYINYVRLYNKLTLKHEYPKIKRNMSSFEVEFPEEEVCFAQKFFSKVIIEKEKQKPYIGKFDFE